MIENFTTVTKTYTEGTFDGYEIVYDDGKISYVPLDEANRHYQEILEWLEIEGNTITDNGGGD